MKTALLAGATGLIGKQLLQQLLQDDAYGRVKVLMRQPPDVSHPKVEAIVLDFDKMADQSDKLQADDVFCCLGTTMKKAKTKEAFKKVDFHYPLEIARLSKHHGATQYLLVSALGADKNSSIYYNQIKGSVEEAIQHAGFETVHIFRPSVLLGDRQESRSGEEAAKLLYTILGPLIPKKYKAIDSGSVARAMQTFAKAREKGLFIHESTTLQQF